LNKEPNPLVRNIVFAAVLLLVLLAGAYLRFNGIAWGENSFMHPDERFLLMVGSALEPVSSLSEYFNTAASTLNPHNQGYGFYVYGTLPMFLTRYAVEWIYGQAGLIEMLETGRPLSALFDVLAVLLAAAIGLRLYGRAAALLAAAFAAFSVLQIQQSHFFTMDTFITFFTVLAIYFAVRIVTDSSRWVSADLEKSRHDQEGLVQDEAVRPRTVNLALAPLTRPSPRAAASLRSFAAHPLFFLSIGFGAALGMAVASKLNAAPVAFLLPAAVGIYFLRLPHSERQRRFTELFVYLILAAVVSLLFFRIFQPYAFKGPGFFGMLPNPAWVANIQEQRIQAAGDVDFPPAMQWARRPLTFSFENIVLWGMGLPYGILAWASFLWMGWRIFKGDWEKHLLLWGWTAFYFVWQSLQFNPTMRYQLPIYPTLAVIAGWGLVSLWNQRRYIPAARITAAVLGAIVLALTFAWAYAFSGIYSRPFTRVEASRWIYQNIPGPINLHIDSSQGRSNQIIAYPYSHFLSRDQVFNAGFEAKSSGVLAEVYLPRILDEHSQAGVKRLSLIISALPFAQDPLAMGELDVSSGGANTFYLNTPLYLDRANTYYLTLYLSSGEGLVDVCSSLRLYLQTQVEIVEEVLSTPDPCILSTQQPYSTAFNIQNSGVLNRMTLSQIEEVHQQAAEKTVAITLFKAGRSEVLGRAELSGHFDTATGGHSLVFDQPVSLVEGEYYEITLELAGGDGYLSIQGTPAANEGDWDDGLPLRMDGYDGFGGIYPPGLNFHMYHDDSPEKLARFLSILDQSEYLFISSNRQWGSLPRIPERFPLVTLYYQHLLGCPGDHTIQWCYNVAQPGTFQGDLGFELVQVFQSDPRIGPLRINTQFAEEAFTVYDHPKVFIFKKTDAYDAEQVSQILSNVDLSRIIRLTPKRAPSHPADLQLPRTLLSTQQQGGTWSDLFQADALPNRSQGLSVLVWYLAVALLGIVVYPFVRLALPGLSDRGYPLARAAGMLVLAYLSWAAGSLGIPVTRLTITAAFLVMALIGGLLALYQRRQLADELRQRARYFVVIEALFLVFFTAGLLVRLGNPDLWHQWYGGEKPMDFAYFNAVLKSTVFPPYDPWYAGGYLNYYYYGFILVGILTKWLGIIPSVAINLILPTMFMTIALGAFSAAWNIYSGVAAPRLLIRPMQRSTSMAGGREERLTVGVFDVPGTELPLAPPNERSVSPYWVGLLGAMLMAVLGNLGSVKMIFQGYQKLAAPGGVIEGAGIFNQLYWAAQGLVRSLSGAQMPYPNSHWYWLPSRVIPPQGDVEPITEFPYFTFLYGDPHAHLFALPVALLALAFAVSVVLSRLRWGGPGAAAAGFVFGGLSIGALYPINLSDIYTYLPLGMAALAYSIWRFYPAERAGWLPMLPVWTRRILAVGGGVLLLVLLALMLYQPYRTWYGQGYSSVLLWQGPRTPSTAYFVHWGLFLFIFFSWLAWETREWMAATPLSSLRKLAPFKTVIQALALLLAAASLGLVFWGVHIAWLVLPLAAWAGILLLRSGLPDSRRIALFLIGTGLAITLMVEIVVVEGDIGRMNTVFKFYLQAWTLFAAAAAAALGWMFSALPRWSPSWRSVWQLGLGLLLISTALYPLLATTARVRDRMVPGLDLTLDGMDYMAYAQYNNLGTDMDLSQDYQAIRWMQENIEGTPVVLEAAAPNGYAWFSRISIYTGLPTVRGWEWHQRQQRVLVPNNDVIERGLEVSNFYLTTNPEEAQAFLDRYHVEYIVLGQVERGYYPGPGLDKFSEFEGLLWQAVYRDRDTAVYQVVRQ
jgi:YYY domain-containing protein